MIEIKVHNSRPFFLNAFQYWSLDEAYESAQKHGIETVVETIPHPFLQRPTVEKLTLQFPVDSLEDILQGLTSEDSFIDELIKHIHLLIKLRDAENALNLKQEKQIAKISKILEGATFARIEELSLVFVSPSGEEIFVEAVEPKGGYTPSLLINEEVLDVLVGENEQ